MAPTEAGSEAPAAPSLEGARVVHEEAPAERARRLRAEADELARRLALARGEEQDLLGELSRLDRERSVAAKRAEAARIEAEAASAAERRAAERARELDRRWAATRRRIGLVLQALHREGPRREWRRLVGAEGDAAAAVASAAVLRQAELERELSAAATAAERARDEARLERERAEAARERLAAAAAEWEERRARREAGLVALRRERQRLGSELTRARADLQGRLAHVPPAPAPVQVAPRVPARFVDLADRRGRLPWPLDEADRGPLVEHFGEVVHPRHGTRTQRHGIVLEAPAGAPIRAVAPGRVVFRDWYKGFGLCLVVDHGHGFLSVSSHARELFVGAGEPVEEGQVVGAVGDTGSLDGPRLYFQLQRDGAPVDPLRWLR